MAGDEYDYLPATPGGVAVDVSPVAGLAQLPSNIVPAAAAARGDVAALNAVQASQSEEVAATIAGYTNNGTPVWDYQDIPEIVVESPNVADPQQHAYLQGLDPNLMRDSLFQLGVINAGSAVAGVLGLGGALSALGRGVIQVGRNYLTMNPVAATIASAPELTTASILAAESVTPGASGAGALALGTVGLASKADDIAASLSRVEASSPTGAQWNEYLSAKYGASNVFWDWPKNQGFVYGADDMGALQPGQMIGRLGSERGTFVSPLGTAPETLSLRPGTDTSNLNVYRVVQEIPGTRIGPAAPAFDMPGYGPQYQLDRSVKELLASGHLERVTQ